MSELQPRSFPKIDFNNIPIAGKIAGVGLLMVVFITIIVAVRSGSNGKNDVDYSMMFPEQVPTGFFPKEKEQAAEIEEEKPKPKPKVKVIYKEKIVYREPEREAPQTHAVDFFAKTPKPKATISPELMARYTAGGGNRGNETNSENEKTEIDGAFYKGKNKSDSSSLPTDLRRVITADKRIAVLIIEEVLSSIAGKITGQVEENIYGMHGRNILIPAGSKAIGTYKTLKQVGDERLIAVWQRMITPDGINIDLTNAELADQMGRSGGNGDVDNRNWERYGLAVSTTLLSTALALAIQPQDVNQQVIINNLRQDTVNVANTILKDTINIKPVMTIPQGTRAFVSITRDIYFPEPIKGAIYVKPVSNLNKKEK